MEAFREEVSYIRARDPSIQNFNRASLRRKKVNMELLMEDTCLEDSVIILPDPQEDSLVEEEEDSSLQVYLRVKASQSELNGYIIDENRLICKVPPTANKGIKDASYKTFEFTQIFGPDSEQIEIFNSVVKPRILEFINGRNSSLFTYGASGAGKTFTIIGTVEKPGLIPRALEYLFRTLPELPVVANVKPSPDDQVTRLNSREKEAELQLTKSILRSQKGTERNKNIKTYKSMQARLSNDPVAVLDPLGSVSLGVWVSFAEIYNEEIYDLLKPTTPNRKPTKLRVGMSNGKSYIKDITHVNVASGLEAYQVFLHGIQKLKYAETNLNSHSSRSHSIFSIKIAVSLDNGDGAHVSAFNFCDLAGGERSKKTMNVGDRLKESNSINRSLMVLGRCIAASRDAQKNPGSNQMTPFRESKLTLLFQRALSGAEDLCMVVNINTSREMMEESLNVLNFTVMTREISIQPQIGTKDTFDSENYNSLDDEISKMEEIFKDKKYKYDILLEERSKNVQIEKETLLAEWQELLADQEKYFEDRKRALIEKHNQEFENRSAKLKRHLQETMSKKRRKDTKIEKTKNRNVKKLQEDSSDQLKMILKIRNEIQELKSEKKEIVEMQAFLQSSLKEYEANLEELEKNYETREGDSFLRNEVECGVTSFQANAGDSFSRIETEFGGTSLQAQNEEDSSLRNEAVCEEKYLGVECNGGDSFLEKHEESGGPSFPSENISREHGISAVDAELTKDHSVSVEVANSIKASNIDDYMECNDVGS